MALFGFKKKSSLAEAPLPKMSLADEARIKTTLGIRNLESMPVQAAHAFKLASDPGAKQDDFVKVIEADEVLSARVIRIANSVYFRRGAEAKDIEKAVAAIGLDELRCLLSATMLRSLLQGKHAAREQIWANAVATAISCRSIAPYTKIGTGEAFLCGLLHDVGKLIMVRRDGQLYEKVVAVVRSGKPFVEAEEAIFDVNHIEVGRWIGEKWHFPLSAVKAIAQHHQPWTQDPAQRGRETSHGMLVKAGDTFAHAAGIGHPSGFSKLQSAAYEELSAAMEQLGAAGSAAELLAALKAQFEREYSLYKAENL